MSAHQLIFAIVKQLATKETDVVGEGVIEVLRAGRRTIEVARLQITDGGRRALAG